MRYNTYGIFNIESSNYSLPDEEMVVYDANIMFTKSGLAYYRIVTTRWQYLKLKIRFWWMRRGGRSKIHIRRIR